MAFTNDKLGTNVYPIWILGVRRLYGFSDTILGIPS